MTKFIAEIGSNHNGDLDRALAMIRACKDAGFNAVKFQALNIEAMFAPEVLAARPDILAKRCYEFPEKWSAELRTECKALGMDFYLSVYSASDVPWVSRAADAIKISSYDLLNVPLLKAVAKCGLPVLMSMGMSTDDEVAESMKCLYSFGTEKLTLLHCISQYPALNPNLAVMMSDDYSFSSLGYSDHTGQAAVILRAALTYEASVIEMHVDLDDLSGSERGGHVWRMSDAATVIKLVRDAVSADGQAGKRPQAAEMNERDWRADSDGLRPMKHIRGNL